jgi:hypothetical protein
VYGLELLVALSVYTRWMAAYLLLKSENVQFLNIKRPNALFYVVNARPVFSIELFVKTGRLLILR